MSVIIRLQNLPWSANALDIRQYFRGLSIPEGGVHIVGGELGDAFIAFSTDEDARQAFNMNGGKIKEVQIKLLLSSRTEMQKVIEAARNQTAFMQVSAPPPQPLTLPAPITQKPPSVTNEKPADSKSDVSKTSDRKSRRSRSRSRDRRRDRSRDRSRDRKDRRRRDRSRSRDRRDRNRDRRERSRSRNRSRTKDRSRSRDRDSSKRNVRDKKKDIPDKSSRSQSPAMIDLTVEPSTNNLNIDQNSWDSSSHNANFGGTLNNAPSNVSSFELMRNNLTSLISPQNNNDNGKFANARNDVGFRGRESWPPANVQENRNNFRENSNNFRNDMGDQRNLNIPGPGSNFGRNVFNEQRPSLFNNAGLGSLGISPRPFLSRPGSMQTSPFSPPLETSPGSDSRHSDRRSDAGYQREPKPKITPRPGLCVKVKIGRGGYGEVRRFFQGLFIANDGIKLINDDKGVRTGIAYVRFVRSDGKADALQRSGLKNRGQPVEVWPLDDNEFDEAIDSYRPSSPISDYKKDGGNRERDIEKRPSKGHSPFVDSKSSNDDYSCMAISNLPPFTKEHDIITMIGDYPLVTVLMVMGKEKRQSAYIQFNRCDDAYKVSNMTEKHVIRGKNVTVRLVSDEVFLEVKRQHNTGNGIVDVSDDFIGSTGSQNKILLSGNGYGRDHLVSTCVMLKGLPYKTSDRDIIDFFSDIGLVPSRIHVPLGKFNSSNTDSFCEFSSPEEAVRALAKNGVPLGMSDVTVELVPRREMEQILNFMPQSPEPVRYPLPQRFGGGIGPGSAATRHLPSLLGPGPRMPPGSSGMPSESDIPDAFQNSACVVSLENVPFRAGIDEILNFFNDYDIPEENVLRRYNDKGHPTGDARVAFNSPAEAQRAMSELRNCKIRDRTIFMYMN